ncbi:phage protein NinX family protein [Xenorhabdus sp. KK7.4]|uniref:phage protein NinX family protein n=1 Tax=Xenorhabdus sp. KK7.4 TaxID=1851572 RepID=UPI000C052DDE|nr:phage protein NinX family protein [Xenorhabdus sp. KK7.4]PHM50162.1 hypothetical protein Xekk_04240 [Xenorhabdus sp. KK7.4]
MKIKTSELTGKALDFSVAKAIGMDIYMCSRSHDDEYGWIGNYEVTAHSFETSVITFGLCKNLCIEFNGDSTRYSPSTYWEQCGRLIEEYKVQFVLVTDAIIEASSHLMNKKLVVSEFGSNHLEAVCRLIVLGKLGDEVEIPDELLEAE